VFDHGVAGTGDDVFDHGVAGTGEDVFDHGVAGTGDDVFASADFTPIAPQTTNIAIKTTDFLDIDSSEGKLRSGVYFKVTNTVKESLRDGETPPLNWPRQYFFPLSQVRVRSWSGWVNVTKVLSSPPFQKCGKAHFQALFCVSVEIFRSEKAFFLTQGGFVRSIKSCLVPV
jgi:hypothetical protein